MKIVTWNVNSITMRLSRAKQVLLRHAPDLLCLQELKTSVEAFSAEEFEAIGYRAVVHGQPGRNGVALLTRSPLEDVTRGFPEDPLPDQARVVAGTVDGLRVVGVYVVNGRAVGTPEYQQKLRWLDALVGWLGSAYEVDRPVLVLGDFNIAPTDLDVHDPELWRDRIMCSAPERERLQVLLDLGYVDLVRRCEAGPGPFTWWDYRAGAFHRGWGLRIDLVLGTGPVAERCTEGRVDRDERKPTFGEGKPSDHAPVVVTLRDP